MDIAAGLRLLLCPSSSWWTSDGFFLAFAISYIIRLAIHLATGVAHLAQAIPRATNFSTLTLACILALYTTGCAVRTQYGVIPSGVPLALGHVLPLAAGEECSDDTDLDRAQIFHFVDADEALCADKQHSECCYHDRTVGDTVWQSIDQRPFVYFAGGLHYNDGQLIQPH